MIVAPHMDDEVLGCGGTLAQLPDPTGVHVVWATDGMRGPAPEVPWDRISPDLGGRRKAEARTALSVLGIPADRLHFLDLPDSRLRRHAGELRRRLLELLAQIGATRVLVPFRLDRHPDHVALNRAVTDLVRSGDLAVELLEYFVYHRWKLLPGGDVRRHVRSQDLVRVEVEEEHAKLKARALEAFVTQTTRFYTWQSRPNLTAELIGAVSREPELFLRFDERFAGSKVLTSAVSLILLVHDLEPRLKRSKDRVVAILRRALGRIWRRRA